LGSIASMILYLLVALLFTLSSAQTPWCPNPVEKDSCNAEDKRIISSFCIANKPNPCYCRFASKLGTCGFHGLFGEGPYTNCMKGEFKGVTEKCIKCFWCDMQCTLENCQEAGCISDPESEDCIKCSEEHCSPTMVPCTGMEKHILPPATPPPKCDEVECHEQ